MRAKLLYMLLIPVIASHVYSFSPPQLFWPQKDIEPFSVNDSVLEKKVLLASRTSDYKQALIEKIKAAFSEDSVYIKCIGMKKLKMENASSYNAIILLNTCLGWDWDRKVRAFLRGKKEASNIIVITTSATGDWKPRKRENRAGVDAIATASATDGMEKLAAEIIQKVRMLLERN